MNGMRVNVIADSVSAEGIRIVTIHARYPRIIHSEIMTHRVFSRNARSSRAVPVEKMLQEVREEPFVPWHWGKNQRGMQASEECNSSVWMGQHSNESFSTREEAWLAARDCALFVAENFSRAGYHKQVANRLLEPFMYIDTLITSTRWNNFFHLRDHADAEPHFHDLAALVREKLEESKPTPISYGDWHLPYVTEGEKEEHDQLTTIKLSVARSARISYAPFDGDASLEKELKRYDLLVGSEPLHASPAEHQATPDAIVKRYYGNDSWEFKWEKPHNHGNFHGWQQYRKLLPNEFVPG